jgi:predicted Rossmann fold flavoprotein
MLKKRLLVVGGGAAGIFCAVNAARINPNLEVVVLEKTGKLLSKVKVSGGGRCNVTHACSSVDELIRHYARGIHFLKKAFHLFSVNDTVKWFAERGVELKTEGDGRLFPITNSSQTIIDCLLQEVNKYGVEIRMKSEIRSMKYEKNQFLVELSDLRLLTSDFVCVACGGYPKTAMFDWLVQTGHAIEQPVPSLFTFNIPGDPITKLMGISVTEASVKVIGNNLAESGPLLITHWGLSGPVVLRLSAWGARELAAKNYEFTIGVNWLPGNNEQQLRESLQQLRFAMASQAIGTSNPFRLPQRLWEYIINKTGIMINLRWADLPAKDQNKLAVNICNMQFQVKGKTTFKEEFVTAGGIKLGEIDPKTMESKLIKGLYFAGEILDVDGITGGFNFQHAWTSGWVAAKAIGILY